MGFGKNLTCGIAINMNPVFELFRKRIHYNTRTILQGQPIWMVNLDIFNFDYSRPEFIFSYIEVVLLPAHSRRYLMNCTVNEIDPNRINIFNLQQKAITKFPTNNDGPRANESCHIYIFIFYMYAYFFFYYYYGFVTSTFSPL